MSEDRVKEVCPACFWNLGYTDFIWLARLGDKEHCTALHYIGLESVLKAFR